MPPTAHDQIGGNGELVLGLTLCRAVPCRFVHQPAFQARCDTERFARLDAFVLGTPSLDAGVARGYSFFEHAPSHSGAAHTSGCSVHNIRERRHPMQLRCFADDLAWSSVREHANFSDV
jgi:hypothetical protein